MMMAVIGKKAYAIGYVMLEWIGCEVKSNHFRNCNRQYTCRFGSMLINTIITSFEKFTKGLLNNNKDYEVHLSSVNPNT